MNDKWKAIRKRVHDRMMRAQAAARATRDAWTAEDLDAEAYWLATLLADIDAAERPDAPIDGKSHLVKTQQ